MFHNKEKDVSIRDFRLDDVARKVRWINNPAVNQYLHYELPLEEEKTKAWFLNKNNSVRKDCVIEYQDIPVGLIGLLAIDRNNQKAEFYISMGEPEYQRKGIASAAAAMLLQFAFEELNLNKIYLNVDAENLAACGFYERLGFRCEGYFRQDLLHRGRLVDRKRYAILHSEYKIRDDL